MQVLKIGIPTAIQGMVFSLSNMIIQVAINSLGSAAIAASTVALNFEMWAYHVLTGFSQACTAFVGLNYGARKLKRCIRITRWCMLEGIIASIFVSLFFVLLRKPLVALFTADSVIAEWAYVRICWIISFEFISMVMDVFSGALRGWGFSLLPAVITTAGICVLRVIYVYTVFAGWPDFGVLMAVYPLSWLVTAIGITIAYFTVKKKIIATQMGAWAEQDY
jgi:Na+-driven multidrug efflux pump